MRGASNFLFQECLELLNPHLSVNLTEEESEESENVDFFTQRKHHRVVLVRYTNAQERWIVLVDEKYSIQAFIDTNAWEKVKNEHGYRSLSSLKGSVIRLDEYFYASRGRCSLLAQQIQSNDSFSTSQSKKDPFFLRLWVKDFIVIDDNELAVKACAHVESNEQIKRLLGRLDLNQLDRLLMLRQGLETQENVLEVEQFNENNPLLDEDCVIPFDQEEILNALKSEWEGNGQAMTDSELIEENGTVPMSEPQSEMWTSEHDTIHEMGVDDAESEDESVEEGQNKEEQFEHQDVAKGFILCEETESEEEIEEEDKLKEREDELMEGEDELMEGESASVLQDREEQFCQSKTIEEDEMVKKERQQTERDVEQRRDVQLNCMHEISSHKRGALQTRMKQEPNLQEERRDCSVVHDTEEVRNRSEMWFEQDEYFDATIEPCTQQQEPESQAMFDESQAAFQMEENQFQVHFQEESQDLLGSVNRQENTNTVIENPVVIVTRSSPSNKSPGQTRVSVQVSLALPNETFQGVDENRNKLRRYSVPSVSFKSPFATKIERSRPPASAATPKAALNPSTVATHRSFSDRKKSPSNSSSIKSQIKRSLFDPRTQSTEASAKELEVERTTKAKEEDEENIGGNLTLMEERGDPESEHNVGRKDTRFFCKRSKKHKSLYAQYQHLFPPSSKEHLILDLLE